VGGRESHDSSPFYDRFRPPTVSDDERVAAPSPIERPFVHGDARHMDAVADGSVALVVTSPPYFAGKQYEQELERDGVPSTYLEYLDMLAAVFGECVRTLEPGGRIAVNVANLGRKPYRSLSADVIRILEHDLGLLLRGELIWQKADGASGSCAWGSFRSAANPVLRDLSERVIIASKGRFDRARSIKQRAAAGLPHESTLTTDDFLALTLDVWPIPAESARRVGHPAPFPVELPEQLIRLYTFKDDLVLDPFMGSGSTLVAAARLGRRYVGYDLDAQYIDIARQRVAAAVDGEVVATTPAAGSAIDLAETLVAAAGFSITGRRRRIRGTGVTIDLVGEDAHGGHWFFDVAGSLLSSRGGLLRTEEVWRALGRACALKGGEPGVPIVLLTSDLPRRPGDGDAALRAAGPGVLFDVLDMRSPEVVPRLQRYATEGRSADPLIGYWTPTDLAARLPLS
jgi:site-specific DNA-methyltransferase (adenine-specific)